LSLTGLAFLFKIWQSVDLLQYFRQFIDEKALTEHHMKFLALKKYLLAFCG
jgi:hypothetical protein